MTRNTTINCTTMGIIHFSINNKPIGDLRRQPIPTPKESQNEN